MILLIWLSSKVRKFLRSTASPLCEIYAFNFFTLWCWYVMFSFLLAASIIRGNHVNCSKFSEPSSLDWLMSRLNFAQSQDALEVLHCLLTSSPEAVSIFTENHIKVLIGIIEKFGKDPKVTIQHSCEELIWLSLLCSIEWLSETLSLRIRILKSLN